MVLLILIYLPFFVIATSVPSIASVILLLCMPQATYGYHNFKIFFFLINGVHQRLMFLCAWCCLTSLFIILLRIYVTALVYFCRVLLCFVPSVSLWDPSLVT